MTEQQPVDIGAVIRAVTSGEKLSRADAHEVMRVVMTGSVSDIQIAALLIGLRTRGEQADEVAGFAEAMRGHSRKVDLSDLDGLPIVDTCGTGGDGYGTFNVSTTAAFVIAGAGVHVAKHGNRAASSQTGSADLLEALGAGIVAPPDVVAKQVCEARFGFMLAPEYHPAMRHVMPVRRGLGVPTVFNILGPLSNPAGVKRQVIGVRNTELARMMATVLQQLGSERVLIVTSSEGADELTLTGPNHVVDMDRTRGEIVEYSIDPAEFGLAPVPLSAIKGGVASENAAITISILESTAGPHRETVLLNAAAGLVAAGVVGDLREGLELAGRSIDSGAAKSVLDQYVAYGGDER